MHDSVSGRPLLRLAWPGASCSGSTLFEVLREILWSKERKTVRPRKSGIRLSGRERRRGNNLSRCKLVAIQNKANKYNNKKEKWGELANKDKDTKEYNVLGWKAWYLICKRKDGGPMLSKANKLRTHTKQMEGRAPLTANEHLLDLGHKGELINQSLEDREDKGQNWSSADGVREGKGRDYVCEAKTMNLRLRAEVHGLRVCALK